MPKRPRLPSPDDSVLDSDDEVDEFANYGPEDVLDGSGSEEEEAGVSQWQPDSWDGSADESSEGEDDEEVQLKSLQGGLASVPLSTLAKAQKALRRGERQVSTYQEGESSKVQQVREKLAVNFKDKKRERGSSEREGVKQRSSKHAPIEISSKRQVSRARQVVDLPKVERRDPRFSGLSGGPVDVRTHQHSYSFLPEILKQEYNDLKTEVSAAAKAERTCALADRDSWTAERERLEKSMARLRTRMERNEREGRDRETLAKAKREEAEKRKQGKGAWYMKKGDKRDLLLQSRFEALKATGGELAVKKVIEKKRKKEASKEKRSRPNIDHTSARRRA